MKMQPVTLYTGKYGNGNTLKVNEEVRKSSFGDPNGHPVPVHGVNIITKNDNGVVTADVFLPYAGLSPDKDERKAQIKDQIKAITDGQRLVEVKDDSYQCGRDSHEAYLY